MIGPDLQRELQSFTQHSGAVIDQTFRALRAHGLMPTTPRGRGVPPAEMTAVHAKWALLMLAIGRAPDKAVDVVTQWDAMPARKASMGFATFGAALTAILRDVGGQMQIAEARICREWPEACLTIGINRYEAPKAVHWFGHQDLAETRAAGFRTTPIRSDYVLNGGALHQTAIDLASPDGGLFGWVGSIVEETSPER